jgi:hypothetical protein
LNIWVTALSASLENGTLLLGGVLARIAVIRTKLLWCDRGTHLYLYPCHGNVYMYVCIERQACKIYRTSTASVYQPPVSIHYYSTDLGAYRIRTCVRDAQGTGDLYGCGWQKASRSWSGEGERERGRGICCCSSNEATSGQTKLCPVSQWLHSSRPSGIKHSIRHSWECTLRYEKQCAAAPRV